MLNIYSNDDKQTEKDRYDKRAKKLGAALSFNPCRKCDDRGAGLSCLAIFSDTVVLTAGW
jgi:hypothetical protein